MPNQIGVIIYRFKSRCNGRTEVALIRSSNNEEPAPNTVNIKLTRFFGSSTTFEATVQRFLLTVLQHPKYEPTVQFIKGKACRNSRIYSQCNNAI